MKKEFVKQFDIINQKVDYLNPLTIGNGNLAFTFDVTGLQTLNQNKLFPLLTMSNRIWAKTEVAESLKPQIYCRRNGQKIAYYTSNKNQEELFLKKRRDTYKFNLFNLAFFSDGKRLVKKDITEINQHLDLYTGKCVSSWKYKNVKVFVESEISQKTDVLRFYFKSKAFNNNLAIGLLIKEASYDKKGSTNKNISFKLNDKYLIVEEDNVTYKLYYYTDGRITQKNNKLFISGTENIHLLIGLDEEYVKSSLSTFWSKIKEIDTKDVLLNERLVKSLYLLKINCCGLYPPAETGLTMNSWYGKFHLEMQLIHQLGLIKMGAGEFVLPSINYYHNILKSAIKRANFQGYLGARWPKMTDPSGEDSPSNIGCLLLWQQPHIIVMIDALMKHNPSLVDYSIYKDLITHTVDFICSFFILEDNVYKLDKPLIPVQECFDENKVSSPIFEVEYLRYALILAEKYYKKFKLNFPPIAKNIIAKAIMPKIIDGAYVAHQLSNDTYTSCAKDHPSVLFPYSFFKSDRIDPEVMKKTIRLVKKTYHFDSMWGWDFPFMALCSYHLGDTLKSLKLIKYKAAKNTYLKNGHNQQKGREDLPVYLPGNGAYVLAIYEIFAKQKN